MKHYRTLSFLMHFFAMLTIMPISVHALDLATAPLASSSSSDAKPNILFILDDSGSMLEAYMPDWVGAANLCGSDNHDCKENDDVFRSSDFNTIYYNPKIRYLPAKQANGDYKTSMTSANTDGWTKVPNDFSKVIFYDDGVDEDHDYTDLTGGKAYYTKMVTVEYCKDTSLSDCTASGQSTTYPYPAYVRFCKTLAQATNVALPATGECHATAQKPYSAFNTRYPKRLANMNGSLTKIEIKSGTTYDKAIGRSDCSGNKCTYNEEMTNYANWWAYYRTRLQTMKTSTSLAFAGIGDKYRVGFNVINNDEFNENKTSYTNSGPTKFLNIATFNGKQKEDFYTRLFNANPSLKMKWNNRVYTDEHFHTPLRAALSHAGRYFANKAKYKTTKSGVITTYNQDVDPMQYSCQANFTILSTDGVWNTQSEEGIFGPYTLDLRSVGNQDDGDAVPRPKREGTNNPDSLADVAMYYAETDLRTSSLGNCTGAKGEDVCGTETSRQNMTTFTVGFGVNGTLIYSDDYKTAKSGDYYGLLQGTKNWPSGCPSDYCPEYTDDLWHAAVNGNGTYFNAQTPEQLQESLTAALAEIYALSNAGSAAAISTLKPVAGNNSAYVSSYTSMKWTGNLESRDIGTLDGVTSKTAKWCVEDVAQGACAAPNQIFTPTINNTKKTYCAPSGTSVFTTAMDITACTGKLQSQVARNSVTRKIYTAKAGRLVEFNYTNINNLVGNSLSQWNALDTSQRENMAEKLVGYVRGYSVYEDRGSNLASNRLFRYREKTLGDITDSTAVYVGEPNFNYLESSYGLFKTAQSGRKKSVYVGANDGMLHAFTASDIANTDNEGKERWAYIPSMVLPNLWKLADKNYADNHQNYVNGPTTVTDICSDQCLAADDWKTVLVGGLGQGGKGFYALDVTNDLPLLLWEFDTTDDADLGYSFGNPVITKMRDSDSQSGFKWVVLLSSGYNNASGKSHLYVLDANTGGLIRKISTHAGSADEQSGLAKISAFVRRPSENNQADYAYGGDLLGNLWRFKIDSNGSTSNPLLLASLRDDGGFAQAITAKPELGKLSGKTVVFIGTGKYLEQADLSNKSSQTLYAIKDDDEGNIGRNNLASRSMTTSGDTRTGTKSDNVFDNNAKKGWYIDLPKDSGERQVVAAKLASGTLVVPTMVPSSDTCSPGGYGWINYIDAKNGGAVMLKSTGTVLLGTKTNSIPVGINLLYISGQPKISFTGASNATPQQDPNARFETGKGIAGKRASWRELIR
jgi:type IV pilus assembly protein PilY1